MPSLKLIFGLLLVCVPLASRAAVSDSTLVWHFEGEALRRLHAETLEDILREVPLLRVERQGAAGLPYRVFAGGGRAQELLLVVDGQPWRDPWSGEFLREELPLSLVKSVRVDLRPALARFGEGARGGTVSVITQQPEQPRVNTRLHVSKSTYGERGRRVRFITPPGDVALSVGLDEFFGGDYPFSGIWNGEAVFDPAEPEVTFSQRRNLSIALHLAAGAAGPMALRLHQSDWHLDRDLGIVDPWYRERTRFELALPGSPIGALHLSQELLERKHRSGRASDASLRVSLERALPLRGDARVLAGYERHQLGFSDAEGRRELPRPTRAWLAGQWSGRIVEGVELRAGLRGERDFGNWYLGDLGLGLELGGGLHLDATLAQGEGWEGWSRRRLPDIGLWPDGLGRPGNAVDTDTSQRIQIALSRPGRRAWGSLLATRQTGGRDWVAIAEGEDGYQWLALAGEPRHALGLELGARLEGAAGTLRARIAAQAELEDPVGRVQDRAFAPLYSRAELSLARPFFGSDARLELRGALEYRGGRSDHEDMIRGDFAIEVRVLAARFWLQARNGLEWRGEEIPGFPVPPGTLRLGIDWHLDH